MATVKQVNDEIGIQWLFSFLSADKRKTYCLYEAPSAAAIRPPLNGWACRRIPSLKWRHRPAGGPGGSSARLAV